MAVLPPSDFALHTPVGLFLEPCKMDLGGIDLNAVRSVLQDNWIDTVRDLKLLVQERCLRELDIPSSLVEWISTECSTKSFSDKAKPSVLTHSIYYNQNSRRNQGICYWLGTNGGKSPWQNPADMRQVVVRYSSIMHDSAPAEKLLSPETLRIVTKPDPKSWFSFDFGSRKIRPTAYMVRHYLSWDTEALRNWNFEASNDGMEWKVIREHRGDVSLKKKGQEFVFPVQCNEFYSSFRLYQTGPNSNRHHYLAISGFDIFGDIRESKAQMRSVGGGNLFVYQGDFDNNGIIHWLGCRKGTASWKNPAQIGVLRVLFSSMAADSEPPYCAVGQAVVRCVTEPKPMQWMCVDLQSIRVSPTHYSVRHYNSFETECLRNWELQGSNDSRNGLDGNWDIIMRHTNDTGLDGKGSTFTWQIPPEAIQSRSWSKFRIFQTGPNSNNHHYLSCCGFEIYGTVLEGRGDNKQSARPGAVGAPEPAIIQEPVMDNRQTKLLQFRENGDEDGLVFWLGSHGKTQQFKNPGKLGLIRVTASSTMNDSTPLATAVGREAVRCVTKPAENSWMAFDFGQVKIKPTHYMLRHYSSWDTEALRFWIFEGSRDGQNWQQIKRHDNDGSLSKAGQMYTWKVSSNSYYSQFRIRMLGPNSNNHWYLSCSGFEVYGSAVGPGVTIDFPNNPRPSHPQRNPKPRPNPIGDQALFQHQTDLDTNGLFYYLGTRGHTQPYQNPASIGECSCRCSALMSDSAPIQSLVGREACRIVSKPMRGAWVSVSINNYVIKPNAYTLRHYSSWDTEAVRNWRFEGSLDGNKWVVIREHRNDTSLNTKSQPHTWRVEAEGYYSKFRILQFDKNSNHHLYLALSGMEIYGDVARQNPSLTFAESNQNKSQYLSVDARRNTVTNSGSNDSWQTLKSNEKIGFDSGNVQEFSVLVEKVENTTNSWRFIAGVAPTNFSCVGAKQWLGSQSSWGYIAGTGGKCFNVGKSEQYANKWISPGSLVTIRMNKATKEIDYLLNGVPQGVAFKNFEIKSGVHAAVSMTAKGSRLRLMQRITSSKPQRQNQGNAVNNEKTWNPNNKSKQLLIHQDGSSVENQGSNDTWTAIVGNKTYSSGVQEFEIIMVKDARSSNTWKSIVGVVPANFRVSEHAWLGSQNSWGYIGGTGGKCHRVGKSDVYGREFGQAARIRVRMNFPKKTIEFFLNGKSQGVAFTNLVGPVMPAVSLTGTGSIAKLIVS